MESINLTAMQQDALKEVANICMGNSSTALSQMVNKKINMEIPSTKFINLDQFPSEVGGDNLVVGLYLQVLGDIRGNVLYLFNRTSAYNMIDLAYGNPIGTTVMLDENGTSFLKELANIMGGTYLSALSDLLGLKAIPSVPHMALDMAVAMVDFMLIKLTTQTEKFMLIRTDISIEDQKIQGNFLILLEEKSLNLILEKLKDKFGVELTNK